MPKSYLRGRPAKAACSLIDHLRDAGITAAVGYSGRSRFPRNVKELVAVVTSGNVELIPSNWEGFPVRWELESAKAS